MFYCINPKFKYQFFSPDMAPGVSPEEDLIDEVEPTNGSPKRNLVGALKALYVAYGGKDELNNNAVDIIYKIVNVINEKNNPHVEPEETAADSIINL